MSAVLRDASTVLALRDGPSGLEVFMVKRDSRLEFLGGAYVFPGGAVDEADRDQVFLELLDGFDQEEAAQAFDMDDSVRARAFYVAAMRELFEEAGILLAKREGEWADARGDRALGARLDQARPHVASGELPLAELLADEDLTLAADNLFDFAHWITPEGGKKRFDTRFFVAPMPECQSAEHDNVESTDGRWLSPADALARYGRRELELVPPTICTLDRLSLHSTAAEVLEAARVLDIVEVMPKIIMDGDAVTFLYPGDEDYEAGVAGPREPGRMLDRLVLRDGLWVRP